MRLHLTESDEARRAEIEDATAKKIAAWIEENPHGNSSVESNMLADDIREGAWRE